MVISYVEAEDVDVLGVDRSEQGNLGARTVALPLARVGVGVRLENGRVVIEVDQGSEVDLDVLVNDVQHRFPSTGDRSLPERIYRPNGE